MNIEILITIFTIIIIPFCKWYLDLKLEEQTEELNKIIGVNNDINNKQIFALKQQLSKIIDQFNMFNKRYENDVRIVKRKLFKDDESISRKDFK
jgi:methyl-accepting chemotaxis protein